MPRHDLQCDKCNTILIDHFLSPWPPTSPRCSCGGELQILWQDASTRTAAAHPLDRTVLWQDPITGEVAYPPTNTTEMPARYRARGFQRVEFEHARDVERFEKAKGVRCEKLWYNSGNGV
jgi:hypothetical protein